MSTRSASKSISLLITAALVGGATLASASVTDAAVPSSEPMAAPLLETSLGFTYISDFNENGGGMVASGPTGPIRPHQTDAWAWGVPTSGPGVAASGSKVWATNLAGPYGANECSAILSPPIDLTGATSASFSVQQWRHMQQLTTTLRQVNDAGRIFATADGGATFTEIVGSQPYDGPLQLNGRRCMDGAPASAQAYGGPQGTTPPAPTYTTLSGDLTPFVGSVVQVVLAFTSDGTTHHAGWYIDDFAVTIDGVTTVEDFEASDGGFTKGTTFEVSVRKGWQWGVPTGDGPARESAMWGTGIDGHHGHLECAALDTPPMRIGPLEDVDAGVVAATLTWSHWFRGNSIYAAGIVLVGDGDGWEVLTPTSGYPTTLSGSNTAARDQIMECLGIGATQRVFQGLHQSLNADLIPLSADLTPWAGKEIVVRFMFASAWTTANPTTNPGWYVDDVAVETRLLVNDPVGATDIVDDLIGEGTFLGGSSIPPGWRTGGVDRTWAWGTSQSEKGPSGDMVLATNPAGLYDGTECSWVETPPVPGALLAQDPTLSFEHWYELYALSSGTGTGYGVGTLLASTDGGETWEYLALPDYTNNIASGVRTGCLNTLTATPVPTTARGFSGNALTYRTTTVDLSAYTEADTLRIRFVMTSAIDIPREGWYLHTVEMGGLQLL